MTARRRGSRSTSPPTALATAVAGELLLAAGRRPGSRRTSRRSALTGGTIADAVHRELARLSPGSEVDWSQVVVWWGDERFVAPDSDDRNERQAREAFLDLVGVDPAKRPPDALDRRRPPTSTRAPRRTATSCAATAAASSTS